MIKINLELKTVQSIIKALEKLREGIKIQQRIQQKYLKENSSRQ